MQIKNLFFLSLASSVLAQQPVLAQITGSFATIGSQLDALTAAVGQLTESTNAATAVADLTAKSNAIAATINKATADITANTGSLGLSDSLSLPGESSKLTAKVTTLVNTFKAKKPIIVKNNQVGTVKAQLEKQKTAADGLAKAVVSKVPSAAQSIAQSQAKQIGDAIQAGVVAFSS